jgi:hypothetical protein
MSKDAMQYNGDSPAEAQVKAFHGLYGKGQVVFAVLHRTQGVQFVPVPIQEERAIREVLDADPLVRSVIRLESAAVADSYAGATCD